METRARGEGMIYVTKGAVGGTAPPPRRHRGENGGKIQRNYITGIFLWGSISLLVKMRRKNLPKHSVSRNHGITPNDLLCGAREENTPSPGGYGVYRSKYNQTNSNFRLFNSQNLNLHHEVKKTAPRTKGETGKDSGPRQWVNGRWPDAANRGEAVGA